MRLGLIAVFITNFATVAAAQAIPGSSFDVRGWTGAAYTFDDGSFSHCAMSADYRSGDTLVLAVNGDASVGIGVISPRLGMETGAEYAVSVSVDRRYGSQEIVSALGETHFVLHLVDFASALQAIRFGNVLSIQGNGFVGEYALTGTAVALERARGCALDYLNYQAAPATTREVADSGFDRTYLFQAATEMISALGVSDFRYFNQAEMREAGISTSDVFWSSDTYGLMGGVFLLSRDGRSLRQMDAGDTQYLAGSCDGDFASSVRDLAGFGAPAREVRLVCASGTDAHESFLTKIEVGDYVLYSELRFFENAVASESARDRSADSEAVATRLARFVAE